MHRSGVWREIDSQTCSSAKTSCGYLRIVVIDKDRLCAQGKAGVPRLPAEIESIVEVGAFLSFDRLP